MRRRIIAVFTVALVSFALTSHVALAATDTPGTSPIRAVQEAIAGFVNGAESIIASAESTALGIAARLTNDIVDVVGPGKTVSYTAAATAPAASVTSVSNAPLRPPSDQVTQPTGAPIAQLPEPTQYAIASQGQPIVEVAPSASVTLTADELSSLLTEFSNLLSLLPNTASSAGATPPSNQANADFTTTQQEIAALQREVSQTNQINTLSNVTLISPTVIDGSLGGGSSSGGAGSFDSLSVSGASSLSGVTAASLAVTGTSTLAGINLISTNCSTHGNGGKLTTDAFGNVVCAADQGGSGSTVGGADTQVQFNSGGSFAGSASFTFSSSTGKLTVPNASTTNFSVSGNSTLGSATSTSLFSALANFTTAIANTFNASVANIVGFTATNATTSNLAITGLPNALLATNGSGSVVATTSIGVNYLTGVLGPSNGGTGTGSAPAYGQLLVGNASGGYTLTSTSSLGISGGGGTWGSITGTLSSQTDLQNALNAKLSLANWYATTTDGLAQGATNKYFSNALAQSAISVSGAPLTYSSGLIGINQANGSQSGFLASGDWTNFNGKLASSSLSAGTGISYNSSTGVISNTGVTSVAASGGSTGLTFTGSPITTTGTLSLGGMLAIGFGGTGTSTSPSYGQLLVGNASGGYTLTSTSSLGILSGGTWGSITGTLSSQTDLQTALNAKLSLASWYATTTDALAQGTTNQYFSNALAQGAVSVSGVPLTYASGVVGINQASGSQSGFLASSDWTNFNGKISSSSLSATYPLTYNSGTGVFSIGFGTTTNNIFSGTDTFNGNVTLTNATSTTLFSTLANFTNEVIGNLNASIANIVDFTATNATTTNLVATNATTTNLAALGTSYFAGNVGIGTTSPFTNLSVAGNAFFTGNVTAANLITTATTTAGGLSIGSHTGLLEGTNGSVSSISTGSGVFSALGTSVNSASGISVLDASGTVESSIYPTNYVFSVLLQSDTTGPKTYSSTDGTHLNSITKGGSDIYTDGAFRDPRLLKVRNTYFLSYTNTTSGGTQKTIGLAESTDTLNWTKITTPDWSSFFTGTQNEVWNGAWYYDASSTTFYMYFTTATISAPVNATPWYVTFNPATNTFGTPQQVTLGSTRDYADVMAVWKVGTTYYALLQSYGSGGYAGGNDYVELLTASSLTGTWTITGANNWAGWGSHIEGGAELTLPNGSTQTYFVNYGGGALYYSNSTSTSLSTWTAPVSMGAAFPNADWVDVVPFNDIQTDQVLNALQRGTDGIVNGDLDLGAATGNQYLLHAYQSANNSSAAQMFLQNDNTGNAAASQLVIGQTYGSKVLALFYLNSGFSTSGTNIANSALLDAGTGATGGLVLRTDNASAPIIFATNGSLNERMRITPSGNVGVGTTTPYSHLEVWGPDTASTSAFAVVNSASTTELALLDNGNAILAGNLIQNSDQRLKTNILNLDASSSLAAIDALDPVTFNWTDPSKSSVPQYGFIAQQVEQVFPDLVSTTSPTAPTPDGTLSLNYIDLISPIIAAIQELDRELTSLASTVASFAESFTTKLLTAGEVDTTKLCVEGTCVTGTQLAALLSSTNQSGSFSTPPPPPSADATDTPPVVQINGDNPAIIQVGASYTDLGATITGPQADLNLGVKTFLNDALVSNIVLDTSALATDTIDYVATDGQGLTSTSTRTVIVEPAVEGTTPPLSSVGASSTAATSSVLE